MIKSELIALLAERNPRLYVKDAAAVVDAILNAITDALVRGDRVELRDFGSFWTKIHLPRRSRNPRTGAPVAVEEKRAIAFKAEKAIRDAIRACDMRPDGLQ